MITNSRLIAKLEALQVDLAKGTFANPPDDYASFREKVGMVKGLMLAVAEIRKTDEDDE